MGKIILCHCEDVSLDELLSALKQGYIDIESIKRYTGIATGKCQGKCCLTQLIRALSCHHKEKPVALTTIRQPVLPLRIDAIVDLEGETSPEPNE